MTAIHVPTWTHLAAPGPWWASTAVCDEDEIDRLTLADEVPPSILTRRLRGTRAKTRGEFFHEAAAALQFPSYFGSNWNAFDECLGDLRDWNGHSRIVLFFTRAELLLSNDPEDFASLLELLEITAGGRYNLQIGEFRAVFHSLPSDHSRLRERLSLLPDIHDLG